MDESTLNDLLECSVCLERLDTTSKVLPCQHTFCRKCLEIIVSSHTELRCPECRVLIDIKIDDLPPNVLLMRILEGMKNASHNQINSTITSRTTSGTTKLSINQLTPTNNATIPITNNITTTTSLSPPLPPPSTNTTGLSNNHHHHHHLHYQPQSHNHQTNSSSKFITNHSSSNRASDDQNIIRQQTYSTKQYSNSILVPHARAIYDFKSKETGDISFKKGEHILLRKRIDLNWFVGEIHGKEGVFPINHVQIIVPLPQPQCKALYDFRMGPNEEEGCLIFKKGALINVFRRVDHNWAEGRIGDCIGIFPIAFVEMNALAKQIMDTATNLQCTNSPRALPPPPPNVQDQSSSTESSSTVTTSPNSSSSSNTSSNSSSAPSSPIRNAAGISSPPPPKIREHQDKRHSLTGLPVSNVNPAIQQLNRHSVEILSIPEPPEIVSNSSQSNEIPMAGTHKSRQNDNTSTQPHGKISALKSNVGSVPNLPANYVALYPYKPQKQDELELKKGSVYYVTERCQDGWFKGVSRSQKSGVFPGNYVAPLRNNRDNNQILNLKRQGNHSPHNAQQTSSQSQNQTTVHHNQQHSSSSSSSTANVPSIPPPELPPRSSTATATVLSSAASAWSKPLGQHVEAFFSRKGAISQPVGKNEQNPKDGTTQSSSSSNKDKKESSSAVSLMKRLTNIKRSKSPTPNAASYSMDNPVFEDTSIRPSSSISATNAKRNVLSTHPVHVRSGSCPSQLLQSLPVDLNNTSVENSTNPYLFGSHRVKGHKERPTLQGIRNNLETNRLRGIATNDNTIGEHSTHTTTTAIASKYPNHTATSSYHRKSQSLDAATISSQLASNASKLNKSQHNHPNTPKERFRCIVSYPPNSEFELELNVGDIVFVHKKRDNGWYKGTHSRSGKIGLFPASFVEPDI